MFVASILSAVSKFALRVLNLWQSGKSPSVVVNVVAKMMIQWVKSHINWKFVSNTYIIRI